MAVFKIEKNNNFTIMSNFHLRDSRLSLKAIGLLSKMLSLPQDWDYSLDGLVSIVKEGESTVKTALDELKKYKYLKIEKQRNEKGLFEYIYNIFEIPYDYNSNVSNILINSENINNPDSENLHVDKPEGDYPALDKPEVDEPALDNHTQINTNILNINNKYNICPSLSKKFEKIWSIYPRKEGKNKAYVSYNSWIKGKNYAGKKVKLSDEDMIYAIKIYNYEIKRNSLEPQYIKMGSTFFNEAIFEYAQKYKKQPQYWNDLLEPKSKNVKKYSENKMTEEEYYQKMRGKDKNYE